MDLGDGVSGSKNEPLTPSPRSKIFLFKEARISKGKEPVTFLYCFFISI